MPEISVKMKNGNEHVFEAYSYSLRVDGGRVCINGDNDFARYDLEDVEKVVVR